MTFITPHHSYVAQRCYACGRITGGCFPVNRPRPFPPIAGPTFPSTCPRCGQFNGMPF